MRPRFRGDQGRRAHERSIMVFAALVQLHSGPGSTMRRVGKLSWAEGHIQPSLRFLARSDLTLLAAGLRR